MKEFQLFDASIPWLLHVYLSKMEQKHLQPLTALNKFIVSSLIQYFISLNIE